MKSTIKCTTDFIRISRLSIKLHFHMCDVFMRCSNYFDVNIQLFI